MVSGSRAELASKIVSVLAASTDLGWRLRHLLELAPRPAVFTTSFGLEDQIVTHAIATSRLPIELVTLDTGPSSKRRSRSGPAPSAATASPYGPCFRTPRTRKP
jgi:hypothetical protein